MGGVGGSSSGDTLALVTGRRGGYILARNPRGRMSTGRVQGVVDCRGGGDESARKVQLKSTLHGQPM